MTFNQKCFALKLKAIKKCSIQKALHLAEKYYEPYKQWEGRHFQLYRHEDPGPYLEKEFIFKGFVPYDTYQKETGFCYIISNKLINGTKYIYPMKAIKAGNKTDFKKYHWVYDLQGVIGIIDHTRVLL